MFLYAKMLVNNFMASITFDFATPRKFTVTSSGHFFLHPLHSMSAFLAYISATIFLHFCNVRPVPRAHATFGAEVALKENNLRLKNPGDWSR